MFNLKSDAYSYLLHILRSSGYENTPLVSAAMAHIKHAIENHEQDVLKVTGYLQDIIDPDSDNGYSVSFKKKFQAIITEIGTTPFPVRSTPELRQQQFSNPLRRHFDSLIAIDLLTHPSPLMMTSVGTISGSIIKSLEKYDTLPESMQSRIDLFLASLENLKGTGEMYNDVISLGSFASKPTLPMVIELLHANNPAHLPEIMHAHFKFALLASREIPLVTATIGEPTGKLFDIIAGFEPEGYESYFRKLASIDCHVTYRGYISSTVIYKSPYFKTDINKGRLGTAHYEKKTTTLGLMLESQAEYESDFPRMPLPWVPDAKSQDASLGARTVLDLIENNAIYVSGPSGMASLLLHIMENMGNFPLITQKQSYLAAMCGYIVGGGFHSFHEVLGPAALFLDLIPGYEVTYPSPGKKGPPPKFGQFLEMLSFDPELSGRMAHIWTKHLACISKSAIIKQQEALDHKKELLFNLCDSLDIESDLEIQTNAYKEVLESAEVMFAVLNDLSSSNRLIVFQHIKPIVSTYISSLHDFIRIYKLLEPEQQVALLDEVAEKLPNLSYSLGDLSHLLESFRDPDQQAIVIRGASAHLSEQIVSEDDIIAILCRILDKNQGDFIQLLAEKIPILLSSKENLMSLFQILNKSNHLYTLRLLHETLPSLLTSVEDISDFFSKLSPSCHAVALDRFSEILKSVSHKGSDFGSLFNYVAHENHAQLIDIIADYLPFIKTHKSTDVRTLFYHLSQDQHEKVLTILHDDGALLEMTQTGYQLHFLISYLAPSERRQLFEWIQPNISTLIQSSVDIVYLCFALTDTELDYVFSVGNISPHCSTTHTLIDIFNQVSETGGLSLFKASVNHLPLMTHIHTPDIFSDIYDVSKRTALEQAYEQQCDIIWHELETIIEENPSKETFQARMMDKQHDLGELLLLRAEAKTYHQTMSTEPTTAISMSMREKIQHTRKEQKEEKKAPHSP